MPREIESPYIMSMTEQITGCTDGTVVQVREFRDGRPAELNYWVVPKCLDPEQAVIKVESLAGVTPRVDNNLHMDD